MTALKPEKRHASQPNLGFAVADAILFLDTLADRLDRWAAESRHGGWSTHQVTPNIEAANECRRMAARLRRAYDEQADK